MKKLLLFILPLSVVLTGYSQNWTETAKIESADQQAEDNHAISVAKSGDYIITGAWHEDHDATGNNPISNAGAAYIYHYNSSTEEWVQEAKLVAADRAIDNWFGISVDISGTYAVIGAVQENASRGAAYVFERNGSGIWVQVAKLVAPNRQSSDRFGNSVSIYEDTIIVGAFHEDEDENDLNTLQNAGSAYIYTRSPSGTWSFSQKIVASDRDTNDYFGYSVAIWDDKIIAGAYHRDIPTLSEYGGAYAFEYNGTEWVQIKILEAFDPYFGDRFGWSVDVYENYYIVGAPYHDYDDAGLDPLNNAGAAYIFDSDNSWAEDKIVGGDRTAQDNAGEDVAIHATRAVLGTPLQNYGIDGDPPFFSDGGAIFVYERDGSGFWNQMQKLLTGDRATSDKFGHSVDLDNTTIIGGAPEDNSSAGASTGALYVFNDDTLAAGDYNFSNSIVVFPNPSDGNLTINLGQHYAEIEISLVSLLGQVIFDRSYSETNNVKLEINTVSGVYLLNIVTNTGEMTTKRIIKK